MLCPRCNTPMLFLSYSSYPRVYICHMCAARVEIRHTLSNTTAPFMRSAEVHHYPLRVVVPQAFQDAFQEELEP
jgi:hypothetical protein